jgi:ketosteroid isomerase-like protein
VLTVEQTIEQIREIVNRETRAWDTRDVELLLSVFHKDMVWPWPEKNTDHDPIKWVMFLGRFDYERWKMVYTKLFEQYKLEHNHREIKKITVSDQHDAALAVVDIDTMWVDKKTGEENHWKGRTCKVYSRVDDEWKMVMHTGVLQY